ncbi:uncharacterized protein LOC143911982 [Arctopsyche grandis]|uniref:uncharacterized protein LOC143911982 n=1 Tax=Arctopsyche grandis TaxID=121162 RepID=UPI00406D8B27
MKYTALLLVVALCLQVALAKKDGKKSKPDHLKKGPVDLLKGKREAALQSYPSSGPYRSSHILHLQPAGGSLSIGAGYSLGGSKSPSFGHSGSFGNSASFGGSHFPGLSSLGSHSFGGGHGGGGYSYPRPSTGFGGNGLSKMRYTSIGNFQNGNSLSGFGGGKFGGVSFSGGSHGGGPQFSLSSGAPQSFGHSFSGSKPQLSYGGSQYTAFAKPAESYASPSATYGVPVIAGNHGASSSSLPSYASGIKGLGAYASSGSHPAISGPLFTPAGDHEGFGSHSGSFGGFGGAGGGHGNLFAPEGNFGSGNSIGGHILSSPSKKLSELLNSQSGKFGGGSVTSFKPSVYVGSSEGGSGGHGSASFGQHSGSSSYGAPSFGHSAVLSGSPIYLAPKVLAAAGSHAPSFESYSSGGGGQSAAFHGSASLSGSYDIPSAGHSASSLSFGSLGGSFGAPSGGHSSSLGFGSLGGNYGSPSASYGSPSFGHDSDSSSYLSPSASHGSISAGHGSGSSIGSISGGYAMSSLGQGGLSGYDGVSGDSSIPSGYSSVIKHGDSGASSYASSSPYGGSGYAGSSGYNVNEISAGKQELPLSSGMHAFSSGGQGGSALISSFDEHNFNSAQGSYGLPKGSYSSQSNVYVSPVEENYGEQRENKYDTIKYSRAISEDEILKH